MARAAQVIRMILAIRMTPMIRANLVKIQARVGIRTIPAALGRSQRLLKHQRSLKSRYIISASPKMSKSLWVTTSSLKDWKIYTTFSSDTFHYLGKMKKSHLEQRRGLFNFSLIGKLKLSPMWTTLPSSKLIKEVTFLEVNLLNLKPLRQMSLKQQWSPFRSRRRTIRRT